MRLIKPIHLSFFILLFSLMSCLSVEADMVIRPDGGGTVLLDYTVDRSFAGIQKDSNPRGRLISLPLGQEEFSGRAAAAGGIIIRSLSGNNELETLTVISDFNYENYSSLENIIGFPVEYSQNGNSNTLRFHFLHQEEPVPQETLRLIRAASLVNSVDIRIEVPGLIRSSSVGTVSDDNRSVRFSGTADQIFETGEFLWELQWIDR